MRLLVRRTMLVFLVALLSSYPLAYVISNNFNTYNKQNWVLKISGYELDYAVMGSSRVAYVVDIKSLDSTYNRKGINIGVSGSSLAEEYIVLREFLKKNKVKELLLNLDELALNSREGYLYPFHEYELLPLFSVYPEIFKDNLPAWKFYLWKIVPLAPYLEFNTRFTFKRQNLVDSSMGSNLPNHTKQYTLLFQKGRRTEVCYQDVKYLNKIVELCQQKQIRLKLITTPIYCSKEESANSPAVTYIKEFAKQKQLCYYDFWNCFEVRRKLFNDSTHTGKEGSLIYSRNLGIFLAKGIN